MSRAGQVWVLPLSDSGVHCLVLAERTVLVQPKMSEYRPEKRVPCNVLDVVALESGKPHVWYERVPLEEDHGTERVL